MVADPCLREQTLQPKTEKFMGELLHTLAAERQRIHELSERMFVVGATLGFVAGMLTIGVWSFIQL